MARRKRHSEPANHERWLVSYADFITLLFAFFVVMFAVSQVDSKKLGRLAESVADATQQGKQGGTSIFTGSGGPLSSGGAGLLGSGSDAAGRAASVRQLRRVLTKGLSGSIATGRMTLSRSHDGIVVRLRSAAAFEPARADLRAEVLPDLSHLGQTLGSLKNAVRIEGHTDSVPIHDSVYRSNWDLSAARAVAVLDELLRVSSVQGDRLSIAGFGSERPIASNDTEDGRSQNRRVDVVVLFHGPPVDAAHP